MGDLKQIKIIVKSLEKEKEKYINQLSKINNTINSKQEVLNKLKSFEDAYFNDDNLVISKSIPSLHDNFTKFIKKMDVLAISAQFEIDSLINIRNTLIGSIEKIDQKIDMMSKFENKIYLKAKIQEDKNEQRMIDDIVTAVEGGDHNE